MSASFRYAAFISYSSRDAAFAARLHRALEGYGIPSALGRFDLLLGGGKPNRIYPVFRDREELAAGDLGERIESGLISSSALIVICSHNAAASPWVQKEIEFFVAQGRADRVFAIIAPDAPLFDQAGADATSACFPPAFRGDALSGKGSLEPLAADARKGKDGFRNAWLKVVAGLIGVTPGQLINRDHRRRRQRQAMALGAAVAIALGVTVPMAWQTTAAWRTDLSNRAVQSRDTGDRAGALVLALAGMDLGGSLLPARAKNANETLKDLAGLSLRAEIGPGADYTLSEDGSILIVRTIAGVVTAYDLHNGAPPRVLGATEGKLPRAVDPGHPMSVSETEGGGWVVFPVPDARIISLARLGFPSLVSDGSGDGLKFVAIDGDRAAHVFNVRSARETLLELDGKVAWMSIAYPRDGVLLQTEAGTLYEVDAGSAGTAKRVGGLPPIARIADHTGRLRLLEDLNGGLHRIDLDGKLPPVSFPNIDPAFEVVLDTYVQGEVATQMLARLRDGAYGLINLASGEATPLRPPTGAQLGGAGFEFAPDRKRLVAHSHADGGLWYFDLATGAPAVRFGVAPPHAEPVFSQTGRVYSHVGANDEEAAWYAAGNGPPRLGGRVPTLGAMTSYDETMIAWRTGGQLMIQPTDLSAPPSPLGPVADIVASDFAADGSILLWERSGALYRYNVRARTRSLVVSTAPILNDEAISFSFSGDRRWLVVMDNAGGVWSVDGAGLRGPLQLTNEADATSFAQFSDESTRMDLQLKGGVSETFDAATGKPVTGKSGLSRVAGGGLIPDQAADGLVTLRRDGEDRVAASLGRFAPIGAMGLSADGKVLALQQRDGAIFIINVEEPDRPRNLVEEYPDIEFLSKQTGFEEVATFTLSPDGGSIVVRGKADSLHLVSLRHGGPAIPLGKQGYERIFAFTADGGSLLLGKAKERRMVYDLKTAPASRRLEGAALANEVCRLSSAAISPLPASVRDPAVNGRETADEVTFNALRGRPWNPCDWRGLFAILPDKRGGGWFEGPTQWFRLVGVRIGVARDYACEETTSGANASLQTLRRAACEARVAATDEAP